MENDPKVKEVIEKFEKRIKVLIFLMLFLLIPFAVAISFYQKEEMLLFKTIFVALVTFLIWFYYRNKRCLICKNHFYFMKEKYLYFCPFCGTKLKEK